MLVVASSGIAVGQPTATVGTTKLGVRADAGGNNVSDSKENLGHDGNVTLSVSDSDTGEDGYASVSVTLSSTAAPDRVTASGTATTNMTAAAYVVILPGSFSLDTIVGESGQWTFAGSFDVTALPTTPDGCITGSVTVRIVPPGEINPSYYENITVSSGTNGSAHKAFGNLNGFGTSLTAGTKIEIWGRFSEPPRWASGTSTATFTVEGRRKATPGTDPTVPGKDPPALGNDQPPAIGGEFVVGQKLTASAGRWSQSPSKITYQWLSNGKAIIRATKATYKLKGKDKGKKISVRVSASAPNLATVTVTSRARKVKASPK